MGYSLPTSAPVSDSWQTHKNRTPPSAEPGTDYACAYGTDLAMPEAGSVSVIDTSPGGGEGRRLSVDLDDGRRVSFIHLDRINAHIGQRVSKGQRGLVISGASGYGSSWYYGPHVHTTCWERPGMPYADSIDFALYVGSTTEPGEDDEMAFTVYQSGGNIMILGPATFLEIGAELTKQTGVDGAETLALYQALPGTRTVALNQRDYDVLRVNTRASGVNA